MFIEFQSILFNIWVKCHIHYTQDAYFHNFSDETSERASIVDATDDSIMALLEDSLANIELIPSKRTKSMTPTSEDTHTHPLAATTRSKAMQNHSSKNPFVQSHRRNVPMKTSKRVPYWSRYKYCDINQVSMKAFVQYLKTGRLCGRRVSRFRFALTGWLATSLSILCRQLTIN